MQKGFTLLELIVVIIIIGILATLGFTQYTKTVEKMRMAEARGILGFIRKNIIGYQLQNGTISGMTEGYLGIGTSSDQIPSTCNSNYYFSYSVAVAAPQAWLYAFRCTAGGKPPQETDGVQYYLTWVYSQTTMDTEPELYRVR